VGLVSLLTTNLMWGFLVGFLLQALVWAYAKVVTGESRAPD
jgi:hypothetical protein